MQTRIRRTRWGSAAVAMGAVLLAAHFGFAPPSEVLQPAVDAASSLNDHESGLSADWLPAELDIPNPYAASKARPGDAGIDSALPDWVVAQTGGEPTPDPRGPGCTITCPPTARPEGEPNCGLPTDTVNGGCNWPAQQFTPINPGDQICGTAMSTGQLRDTDWFQLNVASPMQVTWIVTAEFPVVIGFLNNDGVNDCSLATDLDPFGTADPCATTQVRLCLHPGTWWLFVAPQPTGTPVSCGSKYLVRLIAQPCPPSNCGQAIPLPVPSSVNDTTVGAPLQSLPSCGTSITAPGKWFTVVGTGRSMTASTCSPLTNYDTKLHVFCGDCLNPQCVAGNDDEPSCPNAQSKVTWCGEAGRVYLIFVSGWNSEVGNFELTITDNGVPCTPSGPCSPPPPQCQLTNGDVNHDGSVNGNDVAAFVRCAMGMSTDCSAGDFNGDGVITMDLDGPPFVQALLYGVSTLSLETWGTTMSTDPRNGALLTLANLEGTPIPAGFFGPGSEPFGGQIILKSRPLDASGSSELGNTDTIVRRSHDPVFPPGPFPITAAPVCIQITALSLAGTQPIQILINGQPSMWDVSVSLSDLPQSAGQMFVTKTHPNGGTFNGYLPVLPKFTFTRLDVPGQVRVLDWGAAGLSPIQFESSNVPWVAVVQPSLGIVSPAGALFVPGIEEDHTTGTQQPKIDSCNGSGQYVGQFIHSLWSPYKSNPQGRLTVTEIPTPEPCPTPNPKQHYIEATWTEQHCGIQRIEILKNGVLLIGQNYPCPGAATLSIIDALAPTDVIQTTVLTCPPHDDSTLCCVPVFDEVKSCPINGATYMGIADEQRTDKENRTLTCQGAPANSQWVAASAGQGQVSLGSHTGSVYPIMSAHESRPVDDITIDRAHVDGDGDVGESISRLTVALVDLKIHRPRVIDPAETEVPDADELTRGAQTWVNLDNDDRDDKFDTGGTDSDVAGENEMCKIRLRLKPSDLPCGTAKLEATSGASKIKIWRNANKGTEYAPGTPLAVPGDFTVRGEWLEKDLWIEGIDFSTAQRDVKLKFTYDQAPAVNDEVALTILGVKIQRWFGRLNGFTAGSMQHDSNTLDSDPLLTADPPGSNRVFPDARIVNGSMTVARDTVELEVELEVPPVENVDLYVKSFDTDDPSTNTTFVDPNDLGAGGTYSGTTITYTAEEDNRGTVDGKRKGEFVDATHPNPNIEDADGIGKITYTPSDVRKRITFKVSLNPGDNYRVAANGDKEFLKSLRNRDQDDGYLIVDPQVPAPAANREVRQPTKYESKVLGVWRLLHVENDSMPVVPTTGAQRNRADGTITAITGTATLAQRVTVNVNFATGLPSGNDPSLNLDTGSTGRFQNGTLTIGTGAIATATVDGNGNTYVRKNGAGGISIPFTVSKAGQANATGNVVALAGTTFTLNVTGGALVAAHNGGTITVAGDAMNISAVNVGNKTVTVAAIAGMNFVLTDDDAFVLPNSNNLSIATSAFAAAGLLVLGDGGGGAGFDDNTVPFLQNGPNTSPGEVAMYSANRGSSVNEADRFWVVYVASAWQDEAASDGDPSSELATGVYTGSTTPSADIHDTNLVAGGDGALIWREAERDVTQPHARNTAHEIGHEFGLGHGTTVPEYPNMGLMHPTLTSPVTPDNLVPRHLNLVRSRVHSPGE